MSELSVLVTRQLPGNGLDKLKKISNVEVNTEDRVLTREELVNRLQGKNGVLCLLTDILDGEVMDASQSLKVISNCAVGFDNIDLKAATDRGIFVTNTPEVLTETVADLTWALILGISRRLIEADQFVRRRKWKGWDPSLLLGKDVYNKTLGILGLGRIGTAVARRAKGFAMTLQYYDPTRREELEKELGLTYVTIEEVLRSSDYVTIHVPLSPSTQHLIGERELNLMKPTAYLINTSRGRVVDEKALSNALKNHIIAGAGLDVFEDEPIDPENPLIKLENTVLLPHVGSGTIETRIAMADLAYKNLIQALQGKIPSNLVNRNVLDKI